MFKEALAKIIRFFPVLFVAWISFFPEPIQNQYKNLVIYFLGIFLIFSLAREQFRFKKYFFSPAARPCLLYLLLLSLNIWFSKDHQASLNFYIDFLLSAALVFFIFKNETKPEGFKRIFYALFICAGIVSFFGLLEMFFRTNFLYKYFLENPFYTRFIGKRMMSTLVHPNILGAYLLVCIPLGNYFYWHAQTYKRRLLNLTVLGFILEGAFLSFSRGTWIAGLLMFSFWIWQKGKIKHIIYIWLGFLTVSALASLSLFGQGFGRRFGIVRLFYYLRFSHRAKNYHVTWEMLKEHPFVGIGLDCYRKFFGQYSNLRFSEEVKVPDSIYLMHLAETGLLGFLGLLLLLGYILGKAWKAYKRLETKEREFIFAVLMGFIGLIINMASFDGMLWKTPFYLFWIFLAVLSAMGENKQPVSSGEK
ncbi:MAG: O-antigen ligase family protein [Candidatus Omnitrophica bacterium]|nr:O-antigen ligase family protein [Candidatus Omnitrophota bacterium]